MRSRVVPASYLHSVSVRARWPPVCARIAFPHNFYGQQRRSLYDDTLASKLHGRKLRALIFHPVFAPELKPVDQDEYEKGNRQALEQAERNEAVVEKYCKNKHLLADAEEGIGLCRAVKWDILPGPKIPCGGWNEKELEEASHVQSLRRNRGLQLPDGWYLDNGSVDQSDSEFDCDEVAWTEYASIRRQWAESALVFVGESHAKSMPGVAKPNQHSFFPISTWEKLLVHVRKTMPDIVYVNANLTVPQQLYCEEAVRQAVNDEKAEVRKQEQEQFQEIDERRSDDFPQYVEVCDRNRLVLEIFAARAQSRMSKLQVAMAKLKFVKTKMSKGSKMRLRAAVLELTDRAMQQGRVGMGQTETDRGRHLKSAIEISSEDAADAEDTLLSNYTRKIKRELKNLNAMKANQRKTRKESGVFTIGMCGYTNVGKTELLHRLKLDNTAKEKQFAEEERLKARDLLFQTLDTTLRKITLPKTKRKAVIADSVGFVQNLPHFLFEAFETTVGELLECDVLLHVRDISHVNSEMQRNTVLKTLGGAGFFDDSSSCTTSSSGIGMPGGESYASGSSSSSGKNYFKAKGGRVPVIEVWNKLDLVEEAEMARVGAELRRFQENLAQGTTSSLTSSAEEQDEELSSTCSRAKDEIFHPPHAVVPISALHGDGIDLLLDTIEGQLAETRSCAHTTFRYKIKFASRVASFLHQEGLFLESGGRGGSNGEDAEEDSEEVEVSACGEYFVAKLLLTELQVERLRRFLAGLEKEGGRCAAGMVE